MTHHQMVIVRGVARTCSTFDELAALTHEAGDILEISAGSLRALVRAGRLGRHVRTAIDQDLHDAGLGHLPRQIPDNQTHSITVFATSSPAGRALQLGLDLAAGSPTC